MKNKSQHAYEIIKEKIITGEIPPTADISEKVLQEELGVSRTPVHEAILRLCEDNFVVTYPRKGTFTTDITADTVRAIYEIRLLNEPYITQCATNVIPREWLDDIYLRLKHIPRDFTESEEHSYLQNLDAELHMIALKYSSNFLLKQSMQKVYEHDRRMRFRTVINPAQIYISRDEHIHLVECLIQRDAEKVREAATEHIIHSRDMIYQTLRLVP